MDGVFKMTKSFILGELIITKDNCIKESYKEVDSIILYTMTMVFTKKIQKTYLKFMHDAFEKFEGKGSQFESFQELWKTEIERQEDKFHQDIDLDDGDLDDMKGTIHTIGISLGILVKWESYK